MPRPDFLIIGAMKCGTSTLQAQLALQPGVFMTTPKEPNFFSDDEIHQHGAGWYEALFAKAAPGDIKGEASTHYTKLPTYPETLARMNQLLTKPQFIYMIRNPLQRAISHYIHEWSEARMNVDPVVAFDNHPELVSYGCYGMQIAPYVEAYGLDSIHLTSLEQLKSDPEGEFTRIAKFLGLSDKVAWHHDLEPQNVSADRVRQFPFQGLLIDNPIARGLRRTLVPKGVRTWIRKSRTIKERPALSTAQQEKLAAVFLEDRKKLAKYFPSHPALTACYPFGAT
jgi:hypothetical protein